MDVDASTFWRGRIHVAVFQRTNFICASQRWGFSTGSNQSGAPAAQGSRLLLRYASLSLCHSVFLPDLQRFKWATVPDMFSCTSDTCVGEINQCQSPKLLTFSLLLVQGLSSIFKHLLNAEDRRGFNDFELRANARTHTDTQTHRHTCTHSLGSASHWIYNSLGVSGLWQPLAVRAFRAVMQHKNWQLIERRHPSGAQEEAGTFQKWWGRRLQVFVKVLKRLKAIHLLHLPGMKAEGWHWEFRKRLHLGLMHTECSESARWSSH